MIYLLSQQYASSGELWTIAIVIGLTIVILIIYATNQSSKEQDELDEWLSNNEELLDKQNVVIDVMNQFSKQTPACEKCNSINFQIWELNNIEFKKTVFAICICEIANVEPTASLVSEISGSNAIYKHTLRELQPFKQLFNVSGTTIKSKSSI